MGPRVETGPGHAVAGYLGQRGLEPLAGEEQEMCNTLLPADEEVVGGEARERRAGARRLAHGLVLFMGRAPL